jgi:hypothetical protein
MQDIHRISVNIGLSIILGLILPLQHGFYVTVPPKLKSQDSAVVIVSGYGLDDQGVGVRVPVGSRIFSSPSRPDQFWGPPSLLFNGYWGVLSLEVKWPGRETDHSPPTSAKIKKMWVCTCIPPGKNMANHYYFLHFLNIIPFVHYDNFTM